MTLVRRPRIKIFFAFLLFFSIMCGWFRVPTAKAASVSINVTDNSIADWAGVTTCLNDPSDVSGGGEWDIVKFCVTNDSANLYVRWDILLASNDTSIRRSLYGAAFTSQRPTGTTRPTMEAMAWVFFEGGQMTVAVEGINGVTNTIQEKSSNAAATHARQINTGNRKTVVSVEARFPFDAFNGTNNPAYSSLGLSQTVGPSSVVPLWGESHASQSITSNQKDYVPSTGYFDCSFDPAGTCTPVGVGPLAAITGTTTSSNVARGGVIDYIITVKNVGDATGGANLTFNQLTWTLPTNFTYETGSTNSMLTSNNPTVSGDVLTWSGLSGSVPAGGSTTLSFKGKVGSSATVGTHYSMASVVATTPAGTTETGDTAPVTVIAGAAPAAQAKSLTTNEDTPVTVTFTATDTDSTSLSFQPGTPSHGTLGPLSAPSCSTVSGTTTCNATATYTPASNYSGSDTITYTASDGTFSSGSANISVTVTPVNDGPSAAPTSASTPEDTPVAVTLTATDIDSAALTFAIATPPTNGTLDPVGAANCSTAGGLTTCTAQVTYRPGANYTGSDTFTFTASDGGLTSTAATATVTMSADNDRPVAQGASPSTQEDTPVVITLSASDVDSSALTFNLGTAPSHGSLGSITDLACAANTCTAKVTYAPDQNYNGPDSFTFTANDGALTSTAATVNLTVTPVNDGPVANNVTATGNEDTNITVTLTASDVDSTTLTFDVASGPSSGSVGTPSVAVCTPAGAGATCSATITYTPGANYVGNASFTYTASDAGATSTPATATITVNGVNDEPAAQPVTKSTAKNSPVVVTLTATDPDGENLIFGLPTGPDHGTTSNWTATDCQVANGTSTCTVSFTYTPAANFVGSDTFSYMVNDPSSTTDTETITISVNDNNAAPDLGTIGNQNVNEGAELRLTLSATDSDLPTQTLTYSVSGAPGADIAGNVLTWTPTETQDGTYNRAPELTAIGTKSVSEGSQLTFIAAATDADRVGAGQTQNTLTYSLVGTKPDGAAIDASTGEFTWTAPQGSAGTTPTVTVRVTDNGNPTLFDEETITITVNDDNTAPSLDLIGNQSVNEGAELRLTLSATDSDLPAQTLTYSVSGAPGADIAGNVLTWTPTETQDGTY
ncbi:MAG: putative Ig protein, partial [Symbiobacteriaceae bacterium]|nr:putative Ig protein [Symbiobacteriaceae bacterium]